MYRARQRRRERTLKLQRRQAQEEYLRLARESVPDQDAEELSAMKNYSEIILEMSENSHAKACANMALKALKNDPPEKDLAEQYLDKALRYIQDE